MKLKESSGLQKTKMNTDTKRTIICDLEVQTVKKDIKNMHLGVYPPDGMVRVAAPLKTSDEAIRLFVVSKIPWIKKQKSKFTKQQRQTKREYVSGESHYFGGNRYRLNVIHTDDKPKVEIKRKSHIDLYVKTDSTLKKREKVLEDFYRKELRKHLPKYVKKWEKKTGVNVSEIYIKKMKTKWATSNPKYNRIWINLELAKNSLHCLEYVLVHEITHFLEKNHTDRFYYLMDSFMPQWQQYQEELNNSVLGYFVWNHQKSL
jgi:hypothetical protein